MHPDNGQDLHGAVAVDDAKEFARDMIDASDVVELLAKQIAEQMMTVFRAHAVQIRERAATYLAPAAEGAEKA